MTEEKFCNFFVRITINCRYGQWYFLCVIITLLYILLTFLFPPKPGGGRGLFCAVEEVEEGKKVFFSLVD